MSFSSRDARGKRRRLFKLLSLVVSTLAGLCLGEILVRLYVGVPIPEKLPILHVRGNRTRGWEMIANSEHFTYRHRVNVNSLGLRGRETIDRESDETRVLAIGDSIIFGQGVAESDTVPAQLEECLRASGRRWQVVNGGIRAYSTNQELALLRELGPQIDPDIVVLFWYWNDIYENDVRQIYRQYEYEENVPFDLDYRTEGWGRVRWNCRQVMRSSALLMLAHDQFWLPRAELPSPVRTKDYLKKLSGYLDGFEESCDRLGCRFELAIIPDPSALAGEHISDPIVRQVEELASSRGIRVINPKSSLGAQYAKSRVLPVLAFDGHFNGEANATIAREVARVLGLILASAVQTEDEPNSHHRPNALSAPASTL